MTIIYEKSLKLNMVLNAIKGLVSIAFPLISFPYVSKVLGIDNIGKYYFLDAIISYFLLVAGLGIASYAIREGAKIRNDNIAINRFASEVFTINLTSALLTFTCLIFLIFTLPKFVENKNLLLLLSLQILFKTIGIEWIFSIFEDYVYTTIRSIAFQMFSLLLIFLLVKNSSDLPLYTFITAATVGGANILNYLHARKHCKIRIVNKINWRAHLRPILLLFATAITVTIYVSSDMVILGFITGNKSVGLYSVSVKIYGIVKAILSSVLIVSIPRLSSLIGQQKKNEFISTANSIYKTLITLVLPAITGIILLRKQIVLIISDSAFIAASTSLALLCVALLFCMGAWFWGQCVLIPLNLESVVFKATIISAIVNLVLNFFLIPFWAQDAAAFTTIVSECIAFLWCAHEGKKYVVLEGLWKTILKVVLGCVSIVLVVVVMNMFGMNLYLYLFTVVIVSCFFYFAVEVILKNETITSVKFRRMLHRNK